MDYTCLIVDMPTTIRGFVRENPDGTYTIVINARLSRDEQYEIYLHERNHIIFGDLDSTDTDAVERRNHETRRDLYPGID